MHFELADRTRVATLAIKRCRVPLLVNVSHSSVDGALDLADCAIEAGASGLLLMPPYFFRYTEEQIFAFYSEFVSAIDGARQAVPLQHSAIHESDFCFPCHTFAFDRRFRGNQGFGRRLADV